MDLSSFFHILNPNSAHRPGVRSLFKKAPIGIHAWVERKSHPTHLETLVEWAVNEGKTNLAVWGGDGTLNRVAQELRRLGGLKKTSIGLVPVGTCNDFSRKLKLGAWRKWIKKLLKGNAILRPYDLGVLTIRKKERVFVNNAGFGRQFKKPGYKRSNPISDISEFSLKTLQLSWETEKSEQYETVSALLGIIFNSPYFNKGMYFDRDIRADDGVLSGFFVPAQSRLKLFLKFLKTRLGGSLMDPKTIRVDGIKINVESEQDLYPQVDGEWVTRNPVRSLVYSVLPQELNLFVPQK